MSNFQKEIGNVVSNYQQALSNNSALQTQVEKLSKDNSALRTQIDGLEAENVDLNAKANKLETRASVQQLEVGRLRSRDGNATITLCYNEGNHPFAREHLKVVDFGVSDNCYVVESEVVKKLQADLKLQSDIIVMHESVNTQLRGMVKELESEVVKLEKRMIADAGEVATFDIENTHLKQKVEQLEAQHADLVNRNAFLRERPDLPADRIPAYEQMTERIEKLESANHNLQVLHDDQGRLLEQAVADRANTEKREREIESEVVAAKQLLKTSSEAIESSEFGLSEWPKLLDDIDKALTTPTGSKLLAKVEANLKRIAELERGEETHLEWLGIAEKKVKDLEAEVASQKAILSDIGGIIDESYGVSGWHKNGDVAKWEEFGLIGDIRQALSTPTGKQLLAKIEAGEKMNLALQLVKDQILGGDLDVVDYVRVGINSALSAYRAACKGGGE